MTSLAACDQNSGDDLDPVGGDDARFMAIADRFVNHTVIPTYTSLSDYTEQLVKPSYGEQPQTSESTLISTHGPLI